MPVFTKFKIVEFGERTTVKVNGFNAVLDAWYDEPISALTIHKNDPALFGEPFDFIKYQVTDDTLISNTAVITVNFPPDLSVNPESLDTVDFIENDTQYIVSDLLPFNSAVDRIKIVSFDSNAGSLLFNGSNIYPGFEMLFYDFQLLTFKSKKGTGDPYQEIKYQVGNSLGYNSIEYSAKLNIAGLAILEKTDESQLVEDGISRLSFDLKINNGRINGVAKVTINVNLSSGAWPVDTDNFFNLSYNNDDIENNANFTTDVMVDLNNEGFESLFGQLDISTADTPVTGTIKLKLIDINSNPALVDPANNEIIINVSL